MKVENSIQKKYKNVTELKNNEYKELSKYSKYNKNSKLFEDLSNIDNEKKIFKSNILRQNQENKTNINVRIKDNEINVFKNDIIKKTKKDNFEKRRNNESVQYKKKKNSKYIQNEKLNMKSKYPKNNKWENKISKPKNNYINKKIDEILEMSILYSFNNYFCSKINKVISLSNFKIISDKPILIIFGNNILVTRFYQNEEWVHYIFEDFIYILEDLSKNFDIFLLLDDNYNYYIDKLTNICKLRGLVGIISIK